VPLKGRKIAHLDSTMAGGRGRGGTSLARAARRGKRKKKPATVLPYVVSARRNRWEKAVVVMITGVAERERGKKNVGECRSL